MHLLKLRYIALIVVFCLFTIPEAHAEASVQTKLASHSQTASTLTFYPTDTSALQPPMPSASPEITPTETITAPEVTPTRPPRPTSTPLPVPPPADLRSMNMMIVFGILAVIVIIIGVWLNRNRTG